MTIAERVSAIIAAVKGQQSASAQAVSDAKTAEKTAEDNLAAFTAEVGDVPALNTALDELETLAGLTPQ